MLSKIRTINLLTASRTGRRTGAIAPPETDLNSSSVN
jgi:hypothetical protein